MGLGEPISLIKHTNLSRPQLLHSSSRQSITASEDYYSFSEQGSDDNCRPNSDHPGSTPYYRYTTPPSRFHTPDNNVCNQLYPSVAVEPSILEAGKAIVNPRSTPASIDRPLARIQFQPTYTPHPAHEKQLRRKPVSLSSSSSACASPTLSDQKSPVLDKRLTTKMDTIRRTMTPGVDDSPYIRFAIDQLTRDEEVQAPRRYARQAPNQDLEIEEESPVERIVPDQGLGYMARQKEMQAGTPPQHPLSEARLGSSSSVLQYDVFVPYVPPKATAQQPLLRFLPAILRLPWLALYIFFCVLMLTGLVFSTVWSKKHTGIWEYGSFGDDRYFIFEYLPTILGMILLLWLIQIEVALQRIAPFIAMAANSTTSRSHAAFLDLYPTQFLYPKVDYFNAGHPLLGGCFVIFWLFLFTIPLLASSYNVRWIPQADGGKWQWVAAEGVIWTTIALYIVLIIALVALAVYLQGVRTGLKWDPRSIADIVTLLERANVMSDYADTETFQTRRELRQRLWNRTDRLGYWHTSRQPRDIFYGLGEEGGATRRYSLEQGRIREKASFPSHHSSTSELTHDVEARGQTFSPGDSYTSRTDFRSNEVRRHYTPWFLTTTALLAWMLIAIVLLIAFLVVSFVNQASTRGFFPRLPAAADDHGFSPANFLYSFIPALLGLLLFLLWQPLDYTHRRLAPFKTLSSPNGAKASQSLLLDYPASLPLSTTISAISNGHFLIAFTSILTLIATAIPVLAGGVFWAQWYPSTSTVRVAAHPAGLYALCVFVAIYACGYVVLFVAGRAVALPHQAKCLADLVSWLYQSPLLADRAFARVGAKADLVARLVSPGMPSQHKLGFWNSVTNLAGRLSPTGREQRGKAVQRFDDAPQTGGVIGSRTVQMVMSNESFPQHPAVGREHAIAAARDGDEHHYGFGVFIGRDGKEHLGIDRLGRRGREMVILR